MKQVLITRELPEQSKFMQMLKAHGFAVKGESLVKFTVVEFSAVPLTDWIFFYSKNAVRFFVEGLQKAGLDFPDDAFLAALGPGTAKAIREYGRQVGFEGDGDPENTARLFLPLAYGRRVLFPRAENSRRSVQDLLLGHIQILDLVVYRNEVRRDFDAGTEDFLVFTSPLNVNAYFQKNSLRAGQIVVAIGHTTGEALEKMGITGFHVADQPTEEALARKVLDLVNIRDPGF